jgi:hypothetical protein
MPSPLVSIARRIWDRLGRLACSLGNEGARVAILDLDPTMEFAVLTEVQAPGTAHLIVLPGSVPGERGTVFGRPHVHIGKQAMHPKPIRVPGYREYCGAEIVETLAYPLGCLDDSPPPVQISIQVAARHHCPRDPEFNVEGLIEKDSAAAPYGFSATTLPFFHT